MRTTHAMGWELGSLRSSSGLLQLQIAHLTKTVKSKQSQTLVVFAQTLVIALYSVT